MTVRTDCTVSECNTLPQPVKALAHWLSVWENWLLYVSFLPPTIASLWNKASFSFYQPCFFIGCRVANSHNPTFSNRIRVLVFSWFMPRSGIAASYGSSNFKGTSILFCIVAAPIYIPTNRLGGFLFSIPSSALTICRFLDDRFWLPWGDYLSAGLICISVLAILSIISCTCWPSVCLLRRNVYSGLLSIYWLGYLFFWYWVTWTLCTFWKSTPCQLHLLQLFSPSL